MYEYENIILQLLLKSMTNVWGLENLFKFISFFYLDQTNY